MRPAFLSDLIDPHTGQPRSNLFWVVLGGIALAQIVALWMLCATQVRKAELRHVELQAQHVVRVDCERRIPEAGPTACATGADRQPAYSTQPVGERVSQAGAQGQGGPLVRVNYTR